MTRAEGVPVGTAALLAALLHERSGYDTTAAWVARKYGQCHTVWQCCASGTPVPKSWALMYTLHVWLATVILPHDVRMREYVNTLSVISIVTTTLN